MTHQHYQNLTPLERKNYIGSLVIAVETSEMLFAKGEEIIKMAEILGIYNRTKVNNTGANIDIPYLEEKTEQ